MSDLISRRMMLDKMIRRKSLFSTNQYEYMALSEIDKARADEIDNCIADLRNAPDVEPERKKGEWIKHENPTLGHCMKIFYECSVCHKAVGCEYFIRRSFCPNCGADMRENIPMEYFENGGK